MHRGRPFCANRHRFVELLLEGERYVLDILGLQNITTGNMLLSLPWSRFRQKTFFLSHINDLRDQSGARFGLLQRLFSARQFRVEIREAETLGYAFFYQLAALLHFLLGARHAALGCFEHGSCLLFGQVPVQGPIEDGFVGGVVDGLLSLMNRRGGQQAAGSLFAHLLQTLSGLNQVAGIGGTGDRCRQKKKPHETLSIVVRCEQENCYLARPEILHPTEPFWISAVHAAESKQARDVVVLDVREVTSYADYFLVCSGANSRQIQAIADEIQAELGNLGEYPISVEGYENAEWVLIDYGDFLVTRLFHRKPGSFTIWSGCGGMQER